MGGVEELGQPLESSFSTSAPKTYIPWLFRAGLSPQEVQFIPLHCYFFSNSASLQGTPTQELEQLLESRASTSALRTYTPCSLGLDLHNRGYFN